MFRLSHEPLDATALRAELGRLGGDDIVVFEAHVPRSGNHAPAAGVEYDSYEELAVKEAGRILEELQERYSLANVLCVHRVGNVPAGEVNLWMGVAAHQSRDAFWAAAQAVDAIKKHVPIWKRELPGGA